MSISKDASGEHLSDILFSCLVTIRRHFARAFWNHTCEQKYNRWCVHIRQITPASAKLRKINIARKKRRARSKFSGGPDGFRPTVLHAEAGFLPVLFLWHVIAFLPAVERSKVKILSVISSLTGRCVTVAGATFQSVIPYAKRAHCGKASELRVMTVIFINLEDLTDLIRSCITFALKIQCGRRMSANLATNHARPR